MFTPQLSVQVAMLQGSIKPQMHSCWSPSSKCLTALMDRRRMILPQLAVQVAMLQGSIEPQLHSCWSRNSKCLTDLTDRRRTTLLQLAVQVAMLQGSIKVCTLGATAITANNHSEQLRSQVHWKHLKCWKHSSNYSHEKPLSQNQH